MQQVEGHTGLCEGFFKMGVNLGCSLSSQEFMTWNQTLRGQI